MSDTATDALTGKSLNGMIGLQTTVDRHRPLSALGSRHGGEEVEAEPFGEVFGGELTAHAVTGSVQGRGERRQAALAGRDGDDAATDPALARHPDLVEPVTGQLVQPGRGHDRENASAHSPTDDHV